MFLFILNKVYYQKVRKNYMRVLLKSKNMKGTIPTLRS